MPIKGPLSGVRGAPRILIVACAIAVTIAIVGAFFFLRSRSLMQQQLQNQLRTTAAVAALQFDGDVLETLHGRAAMKLPAFPKVVRQLRTIRQSVPSVRFAYIMRRTNNPNVLEFIADADALATKQELDVNHNGVIDPGEEASYSGDLYDATNVPSLRTDAFLHPTVDQEISNDHWGRAISGYAPIVNARGRVIAVIGLDMDAGEFLFLSQSIFSPFAYLLIVLAGMFLAGYIILYAWKRRFESLQQLENERAAFMNLAVHQLGTPLTMFRWWLEILRERNDGAACKDGDVCDQMDEGIARMSAILKTLEEANSVWMGRLQYEAKESSLRAVIESEVRALDSSLRRRFQRVEMTFNNCPMTMQIDAKLIAAVMRELLDNAMVYSPKGGVIAVRTQCLADGRVRVSVEDNGCGIPANDQPNIFQKFMRGSNASVCKPVGNGLDLFIANGIIKSAGGRMWFESVEGRGSTFHFELPGGAVR
ncbi:hypothetical protein HY285_00720 [Candidatus Peregrinibacteria bacterium]|nr:hypothetical protein [Candidatus Peregrinibacteria bacterium]